MSGLFVQIYYQKKIVKSLLILWPNFCLVLDNHNFSYYYLSTIC